MRKKLALSFSVAGILTLMFAACIKPTTKPTVTQASNVATDATISESLNNDLYKVYDNETKNGQYKDSVSGKTDMVYQSLTDTCATVTFNNNGGAWPKTLTIDFGTTGCTELTSGITRKGKVIVTLSNMMHITGAVATVTVDNYYVNNYKIEGSKTITNMGRNSAGHIHYEVKDIAGRITKPTGGVITWESTRDDEWVAGESTNFFTNGLAGICDDTYSITGTGGGTASSGDTYRLEIVAPLQKQICCRWVQSGSIKYFLNSYELGTVDYGTGTCDASADIHYDGRVYVVYVP